MTARLSISATALKPRYDAVVIGSGYGGGVAACRLARMGLAVAVLERGRELLPGEFPSTATAASREHSSARQDSPILARRPHFSTSGSARTFMS